MLLNMLKEAKVNVYKGTIPTHIDGDQVVAEQDDKEVRIPLECLVFAGRRFPVDDLSKSFGEAENIISIGDCKETGRIMDAVWGAFTAVSEIELAAQ